MFHLAVRHLPVNQSIVFPFDAPEYKVKVLILPERISKQIDQREFNGNLASGYQGKGAEERTTIGSAS